MAVLLTKIQLSYMGTADGCGNGAAGHALAQWKCRRFAVLHDAERTCTSGETVVIQVIHDPFHVLEKCGFPSEEHALLERKFSFKTRGLQSIRHVKS
jgi:hypothetical protein